MSSVGLSKSLAARMTQTAHHVLVIGGGYGGMSVVSNLLNLANGGKQLPCAVPIQELDSIPTTKPNITLLDERDGIFHAMGSPLSNVCRDFSREAWLEYKDIPYLKQNSVTVHRGRAQSIDASGRTVTFIDASNASRRISYDFLVIANGTRRAWPVVPRAFTKELYLNDGDRHSSRLAAARTVAVIGGGAVGVEMATTLKSKFPQLDVSILHSRELLLGSEPLPDDFKRKVQELVASQGVKLVLGHRVVSPVATDDEEEGAEHQLTLANGETRIYDMVLDTRGFVRKVKNDDACGFLAKNGNLAVHPTLQLAEPISNAAYHFAVGDSASWTGIKRAGNAMIMGQYAASNILKLIKRQEEHRTSPMPPQDLSSREDLLQCPEFEPMMALSVGEEGVAYTKASGVVWGKHIKDNHIGRGLGIDRCSDYLRFPTRST